MSSAELNAALADYLTEKGDGLFTTPLPGFNIAKSTLPTRPDHRVYPPALCIVAQGGKEVLTDARKLQYLAGQALVVSIETPALGHVLDASPTNPFLGITLEFDGAMLRDVMSELDTPPKPSVERSVGMFVADLNAPLIECLIRLMKLLAMPQAIPVLYPSIQREIYFWLLTGPYGPEICKLAIAESHMHRVARAIHFLKVNFARPIRVSELTQAARMSATIFHNHFKLLTSLTPIQYQKQLRLLEARRLMMSKTINAETAAFQVGYQSVSQFSREYARMFGAPPKRDMFAMRAT